MQKYVEYDRSYADMTYYFQILDLIPRVNLPKFEYLYLYFGKSMSEKSENAYESISHEDCYKTTISVVHKASWDAGRFLRALCANKKIRLN